MAHITNRPETVYQFWNILQIVTKDGDTVKVTAGVGFGGTLKFTLHIWGVDAPETRTKDKAIKAAGKAVEEAVFKWCRAALKKGGVVVHSYMREFGEAVGDIHSPEQGWLSEALLEYGLAKQVAGSGTNKDWSSKDLQAAMDSAVKLANAVE